MDIQADPPPPPPPALPPPFLCLPALVSCPHLTLRAHVQVSSVSRYHGVSNGSNKQRARRTLIGFVAPELNKTIRRSPDTTGTKQVRFLKMMEQIPLSLSPSPPLSLSHTHTHTHTHHTDSHTHTHHTDSHTHTHTASHNKNPPSVNGVLYTYFQLVSEKDLCILRFVHAVFCCGVCPPPPPPQSCLYLQPYSWVSVP